jgi:hypothetical protein
VKDVIINGYHVRMNLQKYVQNARVLIGILLERWKELKVKRD